MKNSKWPSMLEKLGPMLAGTARTTGRNAYRFDERRARRLRIKKNPLRSQADVIDEKAVYQCSLRRKKT